MPNSNDPALTVVPVQANPFNAETPIALLSETHTPTPAFFVRSHFDVPQIDAANWRLALDGAVGRNGSYTLADLKRRAHRTLTATMECAGNGRSVMRPVPPGVKWGFGAVATARFTGTPLNALLDEAQVDAKAIEVKFTAADQGAVEPGRIEPYMRSLPLDVARRDDTLLVWAMNDEPLTPEHGFPIRMLVPGWYGMASVKWLNQITLLTTPFDGFYQTTHYVVRGEPGLPDGTPLREMRVRALIAQPRADASLTAGDHVIAGSAWSGAAPIERVDISTDDGKSWAAATLDPPESRYTAVRWRYTWRGARAGRHVLMARARDAAGHTQPMEQVTNSLGYGNNGVQRIPVVVA